MAKILVGEVLSHHCDKTVAVQVKSVRKHPLYNKNIVMVKKILAHDPLNEFQVGDLVRIRESRPISKMKKWVVMGAFTEGMQEKALPVNVMEDKDDTDANASQISG